MGWGGGSAIRWEALRFLRLACWARGVRWGRASNACNPKPEIPSNSLVNLESTKKPSLCRGPISTLNPKPSEPKPLNPKPLNPKPRDPPSYGFFIYVLQRHRHQNKLRSIKKVAKHLENDKHPQILKPRCIFLDAYQVFF